MDGKDQLDLDLDSEHNDDDLESDPLSDSEDTGSPPGREIGKKSGIL